ncbi:MAG TPA: MlaD family protein, partial [Pseudonocardia sp.]
MSASSSKWISVPVRRTATVLAFFGGVTLLIGFLISQAGGDIPGFSKSYTYKIAFDVPTTANVVEFVDVYTAGVPVGKIESVKRQDANRVRITINLDDEVTPVHHGATVQISEKALTGQPMIRLVQGTGAEEYPSGSVLPPESVLPPVQLRDVLAGLNTPTRDSLGSLTRSLSAGTDGRQKDISGIMAGLSDLGNNGDTVLQAVAAQSADLEAVSGQLSQLMDALDVGQGQVAQLVSSANRLTAATAGQRAALEDSLRKMPGVLESATAASDDITRLSNSLRPVAADLRGASPDLSDALTHLPSAGRDLRASLRPLTDVLDGASPTLHRTDRFKDETDKFVSPAIDVLRDLNPILRYIAPYSHEVMAFFTNTGAAFHQFDVDGETGLRVKAGGGARAFKPLAIKPPQSL